jgi:hypothetical protein
MELSDRVRVYGEADSKKFAKRIRHEIDTTLSGYEERVEDDRKTIAFFENVTALVPIPQSNADLGVMVAGGPAAKAAGKYLKTAYGWAKDKLGNIPNPFGKKGGPAHQTEVEKLKVDIESRGLTPQAEHMVETPGGAKEKRFVDVVGKDAEGNVVEMHQVGKQTKGGTPVSREVKALDDIERAAGTRPKFHPYNK